MIRTIEDLNFYLREDAKANRMDGCSVLKYWIRLFLGSESAHVFKYLRLCVIASITAIMMECFIS